MSELSIFEFDKLPGNTRLIPESDLYRLTLRSNMPRALAFQDWLTEKVLPALKPNADQAPTLTGKGEWKDLKIKRFLSAS